MKQQHVNSYYAATRNEVIDFPVLEELVECDVCVIGAGYTGLSSALFLSEAGYSVTVLEAAKVGYGASGRNGGQLVNSYSRDVDVIEQRYGEKTAEVLGSMIFEGADIIRSRIKQYDIKCDYKPGGIFAALNKKQLKGLAEQKSGWERYGNHNLRLLDEAIQNARQQAQQGRGVPPAPVPAAQASQLMAALHQAWPDWELTPWSDRIAVLERVADQLSQHLDDWAADLVIEAHKTIDDAVAEVRETIDMARYYAHQARVLAQGQQLPGPTGEVNRWLLRGRGVFVCIAPWNFPLAIFGGQVMAALVTGNAVAAKSAPQTPRIGERFIRLLQACGAPEAVLHHVPGDGLTGAALVAHPQCAGVVFTGSCDTAKRLQRSLAEGHRPIVPLIAETGGINAMIVDSSALPEQVVDAVIHSAFHSAGQRCSALRLLCLHQAVAIDMERMLSGAMQCLRLGWPHDPRTDIGPVIDQAAAERLKRWEHTLEARAAQPGSGVSLLARTPWPEPGHPPGSDGLHWVAPSAWRLPNVAALDAEHFGPQTGPLRRGDHDLPLDQRRRPRDPGNRRDACAERSGPPRDLRTDPLCDEIFRLRCCARPAHSRRHRCH